MDLTHRFTVPVPIEVAWEHFNDIASVAECFPGATVTSVEENSFAGSVKVKLGPIALVYNGSGVFTEKDATAHRMVIDAKGKDKRGNGTAGAGVRMTMTEAGTSTDVEVVTDLAITGKPAQFGRGVMQDVSDKLLGQFVSCLEQRLSAEGATGAPDAPDAMAAPLADVPPPAAVSQPTLTDESAPVPVSPPPAADADPAAAPAGPAAPPVAAARPVSRPAGSHAAGKSDDALDLGATVIPILLKSYWKQAVGALVVIVAVIWLVKRL